MKLKNIIITVIVVAAATVLLCDIEGAVAQSEDLCGGTNGNGQIVGVGDNTFTLKRNGDKSLIVNLTDRATIETSGGPATLSDLEIGDRVTLVGGDNRDGTFTADAVVVCNGKEVNGIGQATPLTVRNENPEKYEKVNGIVSTGTYLLVGLIWLGIVAFLRLKKKKSFVYLLFFAIFYIYLYKVLDYTLIQFQSLLLLQHFVPDLMLRGAEAGRSVNLVPLATLRLVDVKTSLLNILMMMPFGFGLPFISNFRSRKVIVAGFLLSIAIEFLQFITGFTANTTFRIADINDLIFNVIGVAIGYVLFTQFVLIFRRISGNREISAHPIWRYVAERPQIDT